MYIENISRIGHVGTAMITGLQLSGSRQCFYGLIREWIEKGESVWIFDGIMNRHQREELIQYAAKKGFQIYAFDENGCPQQQINIMDFSDYLPQQAEILSDLLCEYKADVRRETAVRFMKNAIIAQKTIKDHFCVSEVLQQTLDQIRNNVKNSLLLNEYEQSEEEIFLNSQEVKTLFYYLNKRKHYLQDIHFIDFISGSNSSADLMRPKRLFFFSYYTSHREKQLDYKLLSQKMMDHFGMLSDRMNEKEQPYHIFVGGVKDIAPDHIYSLSNIVGHCSTEVQMPLCVMTCSEEFSTKSMELPQAFNTIMIFKTSSGESEYWSDFFSTHTQNNITYSYQYKKHSLVGSIYSTGGVVANGRKKINGMTASRDQKPVFNPSCFTNMPDNTCLLYDRATEKKVKLTCR